MNILKQSEQERSQAESPRIRGSHLSSTSHYSSNAGFLQK